MGFAISSQFWNIYLVFVSVFITQAQETFAESVGYVAEEEPRPCAPVVEDEPPQLVSRLSWHASLLRLPRLRGCHLKWESQVWGRWNGHRISMSILYWAETPKGPSLAQLAALDEAWKRCVFLGILSIQMGVCCFGWSAIGCGGSTAFDQGKQCTEELPAFGSVRSESTVGPVITN